MCGYMMKQRKSSAEKFATCREKNTLYSWQNGRWPCTSCHVERDEHSYMISILNLKVTTTMLTLIQSTSLCHLIISCPLPADQCSFIRYENYEYTSPWLIFARTPPARTRFLFKYFKIECKIKLNAKPSICNICLYSHIYYNHKRRNPFEPPADTSPLPQPSHHLSWHHRSFYIHH